MLSAISNKIVPPAIMRLDQQKRLF
uniref:Uncharacterized protein n=1 Tax=Rhizophora mucronata TaxID=61149 RepID=A0A2P2QSP4_RHIMU